MTTPANPDDLTAFLRAQLDDDERLAREAAMWTSPVWRYGEYPAEADHVEVAEHIARHDPARVLAEVDAKRRILDEHAGRVEGIPGAETVGCRVCDPRLPSGESYPCTTVRLLALPFADREGFREEWRP